MAAQAELLTHSPEHPISPPTREKDPFKHDHEIENQQDTFWAALDTYQAKLTPENLKTEFPLLAKQLLEQNRQSPETETAAKLFALATAAEAVRTGHHTPTWEQAAAALHIIFPYYEHETQRIQMATGEGKTFTIALSAIWKALHGESVTIHTDKEANVQQSHSTMEGLYDLFAVTHGVIQTLEELGEEFPKYINGLPPFESLPAIRYGVWSQFIHEYLSRQQVIFQTESLLRGDFQVQREGAKLNPQARQSLLESLEYQKKHMVPDCMPVDEGDLSLDMEESPVVLAGKEEEGLTEREKDELVLAWEMFADQQPSKDGQLGTLERIAQNLQYNPDDIKKQFEIVLEVKVEGLANKEERQVVTTEGVDLHPETFYLAKLLEVTTTPRLLAEMLSVLQLQYQDGELGTLPLPLKNIKRLHELADEAAHTSADQIDWVEIEEALPPLTYQDLRKFFSKENKIFNYQEVLRSHRKLSLMMGDLNGTLNAQNLELLEEVFGDDFEQLMQRITIQRVMNVVDAVWEPMMNRFSHDVLSVKYLMHEGDDYQFEETEDGKEAVLLGPDRQPQPGKEFQGNIQAFVNLKHGLDLPEAQKTIAQIMPMTWYQMMARRGAEVTSISGTQDEPDYIVESTGTSKVDLLPTKVFENQKQKLRAIAKYVELRADVPILLCAQNYDEFVQLRTMLEKLDGRGLEILDAQHADQAAELVPRLEKGKILLLQITARGLDFGHRLEDNSHSFENGLIISANQLPDTHQQQQTEGRLGGKRPSGEVVTFTSLGDKLAQELYANSPETAQKRHKKMAALEKSYADLLTVTPEFYALLSDEDTRWPETLGEALMEVEAWKEANQTKPFKEQSAMPLWMKIFTNSPSLPAELQSVAKRARRQLRSLEKNYSGIQQRHVKDLEKQQELNLSKMYDARRQQMIVDVVVQSLWTTIMNPTAETPLGEALLPLTYEQRQKVMERVFDEAEYIYPLSTHQVKEDSLASSATKERVKMAFFMKDLVDHIVMWVELDALEKRYAQLIKAGELLQISVPEQLSDLPDWLEQNYPIQAPERFYQRPLKQLARSLFLGLRMYAQPENLAPLPSPTEPAEEPQLRQDFLKSLSEVAAKELEIRRKFQAEK